MSSKGFTILEVMVAVTVLLIGIVGIYTAFVRILISTSGISNRLIAAYLAQEGIEIVRNIRDTNWVEGAASWKDELINCSMGCEADYKTGTLSEETPLRAYTESYLNMDYNNFYSYSSGTSTKFKRKITIASPEEDILKVSVLVIWEEKGKSYNFIVDEYIYDWK